MDVKHLIAAAAISGATLTFGVGVGSAAPLDPPPPCPTCDGPAAAPAPPTQGDEVLAVRARRTRQRTRRWWGAGIPATLPSGHPALIPRPLSR